MGDSDSSIECVVKPLSSNGDNLESQIGAPHRGSFLKAISFDWVSPCHGVDHFDEWVYNFKLWSRNALAPEHFRSNSERRDAYATAPVRSTNLRF